MAPVYEREWGESAVRVTLSYWGGHQLNWTRDLRQTLYLPGCGQTLSRYEQIAKEPVRTQSYWRIRCSSGCGVSAVVTSS